MSKLAGRITAVFIAFLFLATSVGFSLAVIWQGRQQDSQSQQQAQLQEAIQEAQEAQKDTQPKEGKLEGTKLSGFTPVTSVSTVQKTDIEEGKGAEVKPEDTITFHYTGALAKDGTIFQSSYDTGQAATFPLAQLIPGWQEGIPGMKEGGNQWVASRWLN